jgi:hypothetical protein
VSIHHEFDRAAWISPRCDPGRERDILGPKKREAKQRVVSDQYGALPYRFTGAAALEVLIVTTRQLKRWIYRRVGRSKG